MTVSKVVLNGTTIMDLTQDTTGAAKTLYGETGHGNDGEAFTGSIVARDSSDLTVSENTVTVPAGHYAEAASKTVASSGKNVQAYRGYATVNTTTYTATTVTLTVAKAGTYNISWMGWRSYNANTFGSQLYKNGTAVGTANTSFLNTYGHSVSLSSQTLAKNDVLTIYARSSGTTRYMAVGNLIIEEV